MTHELYVIDLFSRTYSFISVLLVYIVLHILVFYLNFLFEFFHILIEKIHVWH